MIFRRISYRIALQFTAFVFLLFMVNGVMFFAADYQNARRMSGSRLQHTSTLVIRNLKAWPDIRAEELPPHLRDRVRIVNIQGSPVYAGSFFSAVPLSFDEQHAAVKVEGDEYGVFTMPIVRKGVPLGFVQVVEPESQPMRDVYVRAFLYLLVSLAVSGLTFMVGLFFARRSLRPAEEMMERLEQFTQDASHELRTPLAALRSSLDVALKTGKLQEGIVSAKEDVRDITELVERLLELARLDRLSLEKLTVDCSALVRDTVEKHRALAAEKGVTLTADIEEPVLVDGDSALIRQLLTNLISNAIKFNKKGGTVGIILRRRLLSVSDTGIGIPPQAVEHIFDRFYQADASRAKEGYGLGLALVKRIADLHAWKIDLKSEEGKGTVFSVHLTSKAKKAS